MKRLFLFFLFAGCGQPIESRPSQYDPVRYGTFTYWVSNENITFAQWGEISFAVQTVRDIGPQFRRIGTFDLPPTETPDLTIERTDNTDDCMINYNPTARNIVSIGAGCFAISAENTLHKITVRLVSRWLGNQQVCRLGQVFSAGCASDCSPVGVGIAALNSDCITGAESRYPTSETVNVQNLVLWPTQLDLDEFRRSHP